MLTQQSTLRSRAAARLTITNPFDELRANGFVHIPAHMAIAYLMAKAEGPVDLAEFASSWNSMPVDPYMKDGGTYRERTFATFRSASPTEALTLTPPQPHYQSVDNNGFAGGIERYLSEPQDDILNGPVLRALLDTGQDAVEALTHATSMKAENHHFRIKTCTELAGQPTPEGLHRDGVSFVLIMLIARVNVMGAETTLTDADGNLITKLTMREPFECLILDDERMMHSVSEIAPIDPDRPGYRDTVVLTFTAD